MNRRKSLTNLTVFFLISMLGISALHLNQGVNTAFGQAENWYVGKGAKADTYYTY